MQRPNGIMTEEKKISTPKRALTQGLVISIYNPSSYGMGLDPVRRMGVTIEAASKGRYDVCQLNVSTVLPIFAQAVICFAMIAARHRVGTLGVVLD